MCECVWEKNFPDGAGIPSSFPENPFIWKRHIRKCESKQRPVIVNLNVDPGLWVPSPWEESRRRHGWRFVSDWSLFQVKNRLFKGLRHTGRCVTVYYATQKTHTHILQKKSVLKENSLVLFLRFCHHFLSKQSETEDVVTNPAQDRSTSGLQNIHISGAVMFKGS